MSSSSMVGVSMMSVMMSSSGSGSVSMSVVVMSISVCMKVGIRVLSISGMVVVKWCLMVVRVCVGGVVGI